MPPDRGWHARFSVLYSRQEIGEVRKENDRWQT